MSVALEVIEERVSEHRKTIDHLRKHSHDLTSSFIAMGETLKNANKDIESLFMASKLLSEKIDKFSASLQEAEIKNGIFKSIIMTWPRYIAKAFFYALIICLAFEHHNFEHLVKLIGL